MRKTASEWIANLWATVGLSMPTGSGEQRLQVDAVELRLRESDGGGAVVVEADGGPLPQDPRERAQLVSRLLQLNLGLMTTNAAAGVLAETAPGLTVVRYVAAWPLGRGGLDGLTAVVDDVIHRAELHRAEFSHVERPRPRAVRPAETDFDPRFIFRP